MLYDGMLDYGASLAMVREYVSDPDACVNIVAGTRWPHGVRCVRCHSKQVSFISTRSTWNCLKCRKQFSVRVGTALEKSQVPISKWLTAIWIMANSRERVTSYNLSRTLEINQRSAWRLKTRIGNALPAERPKSLSRKTTVPIPGYQGFRWLLRHVVRESKNGASVAPGI